VIIHRSIFKELLINFLAVISFLSVVLFMEKFVRLTRLTMGRGIAFEDVLKVFLYLQPSILLLSIPMAVLIAIFLTYGRMSADNEIVILKGSGMNFWFISKAAVMLSIAGFLILSLISLYLLPGSTRLFKETMYDTIVKKVSMIIEEGTFSTVFKGTVIFVKEMPSRDKFKGIFIYREGDTKEPLIIVSEQGAIDSNPEDGVISMNMRNGVIHAFGEKGTAGATFSAYDFVLTAVPQAQKELKPGEIELTKLWKGRKGNLQWMMELNRRLSIPFACIIFGFLGPALSMRIGKTGRLGGFTFSLSVLILYYVLLILSEGLVKTGKLSPSIGGWIPNIVLGAMAVFFYSMAYKDKPTLKFKA